MLNKIQKLAFFLKITGKLWEAFLDLVQICRPVQTHSTLTENCLLSALRPWGKAVWRRTRSRHSDNAKNNLRSSFYRKDVTENLQAQKTPRQRLWKKYIGIIFYMKLLDISYGYSRDKEWNFGVAISIAKKTKGGTAIARKGVLSATDFLEEFLIMDVIFLQEFLSINHDETKQWHKPSKKINTLKCP